LSITSFAPLLNKSNADPYSLRESLLEIGFLNPQNPEYTLGMIRRLLSRTGLSVPEVRMLRGLFRQLVWYIRKKSS